jgi:hypothetical protein
MERIKLAAVKNGFLFRSNYCGPPWPGLPAKEKLSIINA